YVTEDYVLGAEFLERYNICLDPKRRRLLLPPKGGDRDGHARFRALRPGPCQVLRWGWQGVPRAWPSASSLTPDVVIDDLPHLARLGNAIDAIDLVRERIGLNTSE